MVSIKYPFRAHLIVFRVHFIPLSSTYKEIYNIYAFFSGPTTHILQAANSTQLLIAPEEREVGEGDSHLRRIARAGKQWKKTIGRTVDMEGQSVIMSFLNC